MIRPSILRFNARIRSLTGTMNTKPFTVFSCYAGKDLFEKLPFLIIYSRV